MSDNLIALQNRFLGQGETIYDHLARLDGPLTDEALAKLAADTGLPPAHVRTVAKFYDDFKQPSPATTRLRVCNGEACYVAGASACRQRAQTDLAATQNVAVETVTCLGYCGQGPMAMVTRGHDVRVCSLRDDNVERVVSALRKGDLPQTPELRNAIYPSPDAASNVLLRNMHREVDSLTTARQWGAYNALEQALAREPQFVIEEIAASKLRGRGGAGFPTGAKLAAVRRALAPNGVRYVVCNADEGDAGAYIDKELLERDPHAILEGMALAAWAVGASAGYIYLRGEYPHAHQAMQRALDEATAAGLLGANVLGSDFSFHVELVAGHGAYICGEETSLLRSLEGVPAQVSPKPPYPSDHGFRGSPTVVNNVETLAALPWIVANGGERFAQLGTEQSRGTKLVSLNDAVMRPGLYEIELGMPLRTLLFERAGGMVQGKTFKAVQIGGPLGGILSEQHLDVPLSFEGLAQVGGMLGHAGIVVYPQDVDLVELGRNLMAFCAVESCGKCFPCRIGSVRGTELFDKMLQGHGTQQDLDLLAELSETMAVGSLCALGGAIPMPIENLLTSFISDFARYIPGAQTPQRLRGASATT